MSISGMWSLPSEWASYDTPPCPQVRYTFSFNTFRVARNPSTGTWMDGEIEDIRGDFCFLCTDRRLELEGWIWANNVGFGTPAAGYGGNIFAPCARGVLCVERGDYLFDSVPWQRGFRRGAMAEPGEALRSNELSLVQGLDQAVTLSWMIEEVDDTGGIVTRSSDDAGWCSGRYEIPAPRTSDAVGATRELIRLQSVLWDSPGPEGTCGISVLMTTRMVP
jgi:hypothetical protein